MTDQVFYHGTKAQLQPGDLLVPGYGANIGSHQAAWIYFSGTLDVAVWGAELAQGGGRGHIYIVEPTGPHADGPNLTDKKFPGNPTKSYRSQQPLRIVAELIDWEGHPPEQLAAMRASIERLMREGAEIVN